MSGILKTCYYIFIVLLLSSSTTLSQTATLTPMAPFPGDTRWAAVSFSINGFGYMGTGDLAWSLDGGSEDFWKYDPVNNVWSQIASLTGRPLTEAMGFVLNGKGYVVGGQPGDTGFSSSELHEYDPIINSWSLKSPYPQPGPVGGVVTTLNGLAYAGTGLSSEPPYVYSNNFYCYNPITDAWTLKAPFPVLTERGFCFSVNGKIYYGGGAPNIGNEFYEYDPLSNNWTQKNDLPFVNPAFYGFTNSRGFSTSTDGYVFGGFPVNPGLLAQLQKYDPVNDSWTLVFNGDSNYYTRIMSASIFVINDIPYITQGVGSGNENFPGLYAVNFITGTEIINEQSGSFTVSNFSDDKISMNVISEKSNLVFDLYTITGKSIASFNIKNGQNEFHVPGIVDGIYVYRISGNKSLLISRKILAF